jgi:hypothetical protein
MPCRLKFSHGRPIPRRSKKSDPSVLRDKLFQKACPELERDRIFNGASLSKKNPIPQFFGTSFLKKLVPKN